MKVKIKAIRLETNHNGPELWQIVEGPNNVIGQKGTRSILEDAYPGIQFSLASDEPSQGDDDTLHIARHIAESMGGRAFTDESGRIGIMVPGDALNDSADTSTKLNMILGQRIFTAERLLRHALSCRKAKRHTLAWQLVELALKEVTPSGDADDTGEDHVQG